MKYDVYTVVEKKVMVEVISIGKREEFAAYKDASQRTKSANSDR